MAVRVLCAFVSTAAGRHEDRAVTSEGDSRCATRSCAGDEDIADVGECLAIEASACEGQRVLRALQRLRVCQVDQMVLRELRMERNIHQSGEALRAHSRNARNGLGVQHTIPDEPQLSSALGHEHRAIR